MQPLNGPGFSLHQQSTSAPDNTPSPTSSVNGKALTPAQQATLKKLVIDIAVLNSTSQGRIWSRLYHQLGIRNSGELMARDFQSARQLLQIHLAQTKDSDTQRVSLAQLKSSFEQKNNPHTRSNVIEQQSGHSRVHSEPHPKLRHHPGLVQMTGFSGIQTVLVQRYLAAKYPHIQLLVDKMNAATHESSTQIWQGLFHLMNRENTALPSEQQMQLFFQFLQVKIAISQQTGLSLTSLYILLQQPPDNHEQQLLTQYCFDFFQARPSTSLNPSQINTIINILFTHRMQNIPILRHYDYATHLHALILNPLISLLPELWRFLLKKPSLMLVAIVITVMLLIISILI